MKKQNAFNKIMSFDIDTIQSKIDYYFSHASLSKAIMVFGIVYFILTANEIYLQAWAGNLYLPEIKLYIIKFRFPFLVALLYILIVEIPENKRWYLLIPFIIYYMCAMIEYTSRWNPLFLPDYFSTQHQVQFFIYSTLTYLSYTILLMWITIMSWWQKDN